MKKTLPMMVRHIKVLLIEDDEDDVILAKEYFSRIETFKVDLVWEASLGEARRKILQGDFDVFLIDYNLGGETGLDLVKFIQQRGVLTPSIILTGQNNLNVDIDASRFGAADYLVKDELNASVLERSIRYALSQSKIIRELNEKESKYRSLFERSMDPLLLATKSLSITDVNDSFLKLFAYSADQIRGMSLSNFFADPEGYEMFRSAMSETEQIKDLELTMVTKTGEKKECVLNCVYIPHPTLELCCFQCIVHDLTLRKQAEKDLIIAERLSLTGRLARTIAHEVRNPLTNLNLALNQLREEIPLESESGKLYGDIIQRNADRIEQLVGQMLRSSKPKELNLELVPVADMLNGTLKLALDRINLNQMELLVECAEDLPQILIDKEKMEVALLNIVINAIEAMVPGEGKLEIRAILENHTLTVSINDNGKGIPADDLNKLFDPFFTGKPSGMGLGLTSTRNILNSHHAQVEVKSELSKGTTFLIHFTLAA